MQVVNYSVMIFFCSLCYDLHQLNFKFQCAPDYFCIPRYIQNVFVKINVQGQPVSDFKKMRVTLSALKLQKHDAYANGRVFTKKPKGNDAKWAPSLIFLRRP